MRRGSLLNLRTLGGAYYAGGFDPASLWSSNAGSLYEPVAGRVWTDTGGTTAAVAGNIVARVDALAGASVNAIQSSGSLRPVLGRAPLERRNLIQSDSAGLSSGWGNSFISNMTVGTNTFTVTNNEGFGYRAHYTTLGASLGTNFVISFDAVCDQTIANVPLRVTNGSTGLVALVNMTAGVSQRVVVPSTGISFASSVHVGLEMRNAIAPGGTNATGFTVTITNFQLEAGTEATAYQNVVSNLDITEDGVSYPYIQPDRTDDALVSTYATGFTGEMFLATRTLGVTRYGFTIPNGQTHSLGRFMPNSNVIAWGTRAGTMTDAQYANLRAHYEARGASGDFSGVTNFTNYWLDWNRITSFPLIDTSSGTTFSSAWLNCTGLTSFPSNFFDGCLATNFTSAFTNTNLSQASIDAILVSIASNGTSSGTFNQSGGSAPSATGNAAIDSLRSRGWTVTVTGGY